jgi:hypothetical protein
VTVTGHTPPTHVTDDSKYAKLKCIYNTIKLHLIIKKKNKIKVVEIRNNALRGIKILCYMKFDAKSKNDLRFELSPLPEC